MIKLLKKLNMKPMEWFNFQKYSPLIKIDKTKLRKELIKFLMIRNMSIIYLKFFLKLIQKKNWNLNIKIY